MIYSSLKVTDPSHSFTINSRQRSKWSNLNGQSISHVLIGVIMVKFQNGVVLAPQPEEHQHHQLKAPFHLKIVMQIVIQISLTAWINALVIPRAHPNVQAIIFNVLPIVTIQIMCHPLPLLKQRQPRPHQKIATQIAIPNFSIAWMLALVIPSVPQTAQDFILNALQFVMIRIMFHQQPLQQMNLPLQNQLQLKTQFLFVTITVMRIMTDVWTIAGDTTKSASKCAT